MNIRTIKKGNKYPLNSLYILFFKWNSKNAPAFSKTRNYITMYIKNTLTVWIDDVSQDKPTEVVINGKTKI